MKRLANIQQIYLTEWNHRWNEGMNDTGMKNELRNEYCEHLLMELLWLSGRSGTFFLSGHPILFGIITASNYYVLSHLCRDISICYLLVLQMISEY